MRRFFLSGQTTCALLLGAGLLLRAQSALTKPEATTITPQARLLSPKPRQSELFGERAPRVLRAPQPSAAAPEQHLQGEPHKVRKGFVQSRTHRGRKCGGVALASRQFGCG
jgi:hypothetical protein